MDTEIPVGPSTGEQQKWFRFGVLIAIANLLFIVAVVLLLEYDLVLGLTFAVVVSITSGLAITVWALSQR